MIKKSLLLFVLVSTPCFISGNHGKDIAAMMLVQNRSSAIRSSDIHHALSIGQKKAVNSSHQLGAIGLGHNGTPFYVEKDGIQKLVHNYDVDKTLRSIPKEKLPQFFKHGYVSVNQLSNGEYKLNAHVRGEGGGYAGKFTVHFIAHSTIAIVSACTGPAAGPTAASLEATFLPTIEAASNVGAIVGGILGGVASGPA